MSLNISIPTTYIPHLPHKDIGEPIVLKSKALASDTEEELVIDVASELSIAPKDIYKHLQVELGKTVEEGSVLAQKKSLLHTAHALASHRGEVRRIDHISGTITLVTSASQEHAFEISGVYKGTDKGMITISVPHGVAAPVSIAVPTSFSGLCAYCDDPTDIDESKCEGRIVIAPSLSSIELSKVCAFEPIAIITNKLVYYTNDIPQLQISDETLFKKIMENQYERGLYIGSSRECYLFSNDQS
ncbi:MAG: hypothetical protein NUV52_03870 [Candidatus Roizmanbacteria bacterium]|nr:hypothetical protein [Candidatus Roizmanbacteria bacterium]